jgi:hypothetical protein
MAFEALFAATLENCVAEVAGFVDGSGADLILRR